MDLTSLKETCERLRAVFDAKDHAREQALPLARAVIRNSADAIRAIHRGEFDQAAPRLTESRDHLARIDECLRPYPDVYYAGFVQDAQKEHAEALITQALVRGEPVPGPEEIGVDPVPYLGGLGEAVGELRRHLLDEVRARHGDWSEEMLSAMDDIYYLMVSFDYPSGVAGNLKRITDVARSIIEKTRGDLTNAVRQQRLEASMQHLQARVERMTESESP
jgi:translin